MAFDQEDFKIRLESSLTYMTPWLEEAQIDFNYFALKQWDPNVVSQLKEEGKPALVFDKTRHNILRLAGAQITERFEGRFLGREDSVESADSKLGENFTSLSRYNAKRGNFKFYESLAFQDNLICGVGCTEMRVIYDLDPRGNIVLTRVPVWEIMWDPASIEPNMMDARWVIRDKWVDYDELESMFGSRMAKEVKTMASAGIGDAHTGVNDAGGDTSSAVGQAGGYGSISEGVSDQIAGKSRGNFYDPKSNRVRLFELQRFERRYHHRMMHIDLESEEFSQAVSMIRQGAPPEEVMSLVPLKDTLIEGRDEYERTLQDEEAKIEQLNRAISAPSPSVSVTPEELSGVSEGVIPYPTELGKFPVRIYYQSFHTGGHMVDEPTVTKLGGYNYTFMTGFEDWSNDDRKRRFFGVMRPMRDPQNYANKFLSQAVHLFTANPKGALLYERGMFEDEATLRTEYAKATGLIPCKDGSLSPANGKPRFVQLSSNVSLRGIENLLYLAIDSVSEAAGMSRATSLAGDLRRTSGEALDKVIGQNLQAQSNPFDSLSLYRYTTQRLHGFFIQNHMDEDLIAQILGDSMAPGLIEMLDTETITDEIDVFVEEVPSSSDEKERMFALFMESGFIPQLLSQGVPIPPDIADFFPGSADSLKKIKDGMAMIYELQMTSLEIQKIQAEAQLAQIQAAVRMGDSTLMNMQPGQPQDGGGPPPQGEQPQ